MNTYHAALWSDSSSSDVDSHYRTTHHQRTKQHGMEERRVQDSWTLDGQGPWRQAGEYRRPKEELEAAKAERWQYEASAAGTRGSPHIFLGGGTLGDWRSQAIDLSQLPVLTGSSVVLIRHRVMW